MVIIVMGPSGCGKTTVGKLLAEKLDWQFQDADDYHPAGNVEKMRNGTPLTDEDRKPWLEELANHIRAWNSQKNHTILACSALKSIYRDMLGVDQTNTISVYLQGDIHLISRRLQERTGHYMNPTLLQSQFDTLEEPEDGLTVKIDQKPEVIVKQIISKLKLEEN